MKEGKRSLLPRVPWEIHRKPMNEQLEHISTYTEERIADIYTLFDVGDDPITCPLSHLKRPGW